MAVGEHLADRVVGLEQRRVARPTPEHGKFARPSEFLVPRIKIEFGWRRDDARLRLAPGVAPILFRIQLERAAHKFVALRVVGLELLARADWAVVPIVHAVA